MIRPAPLETPPRFTARERRVIARLRTPDDVQRHLNRLPYNVEKGGETLRTFRGVVRDGTAHCLEAALFAATVLEAHGYPPLVLSFESTDLLDHVIFVYRGAGGWGSVARSRDPGLHGRAPVFKTARALAASYLEPYIDFSGDIRAFAVVDLRVLGRYDWRLSPRNVWKVEQMLIDWPHRPLRLPAARVGRLRAWYRRFRAAYPGVKPVDYPGRDRWTALPAECRAGEGLTVEGDPWVSRGRNRASAA
jgi:hypothetical protein